MPVEHLASTGTGNCSTSSVGRHRQHDLGQRGSRSPAIPAVQADWGDTVEANRLLPARRRQIAGARLLLHCARRPAAGPARTAAGTKYGSVTVAVKSSITFSSPGLGGAIPNDQKNDTARERRQTARHGHLPARRQADVRR